MSVLVTKADGTQEMFKMAKLRSSLRRAGATKPEITEICNAIEGILYDGIKTQAIYRKAFELLRKSEHPTAARYSMRRALFSLGPTGFPFEDFLARLFEAEGYTTQTRVTLQGKCAQHELDVAAYNETNSFVAEAKFHSRPGVKSDLQVALYTFARKMDLSEQRICQADICGIKDVMLVTNTKFSSTAIKYAECAGLTLLSWNYPRGNTLHDRIAEATIYPVTTLSNLSQRQKQILLQNGVILCRDIIKKPQSLQRLGLSWPKMETVLTEARQLCNE
jgi:hypothetical protein